jgi:cell division protein FtsI/penicillin-binding protein 2
MQRAEAFRFNKTIDFPIPTDISLASIPSDALGFASAAAGFGDVYLSPLHGAALASVAANGGYWPVPALFEKDVQPHTEDRRVVTAAEAKHLTDMMEKTITEGTAFRVFRERGYRVAGAVGKTGSLADRNPYRDYSWFVGFAPRDNPRIAVAAVIVNDWKWRIKASYLGREAMRLYLEPPRRSAARGGR